MKYKIKIKTGFRQDQFVTIDANEAHKAYYLFLNPDQRGIFENGVAIRGQDIQGIEPDYNATMGWNPTHTLTSDDWNEMSSKGIDRKLRSICSKAEKVARLDDPKINLSLQEAVKEIPELNFSKNIEELASKMRL